LWLAVVHTHLMDVVAPPPEHLTAAV